ncbi:MAG: outer membrane beta-barrel protein [Algibacter sp.]
MFGLAHVNAQDVEFGVKGGLNFATITGDNTTSDQIVTAFNFGTMVEIKISEKFSLQPELMYSGQGYSTDGSDNLIALNYLNVPLTANALC